MINIQLGKMAIQMPISFFFQADDGIRGHCVTGVQTCALPIFLNPGARWLAHPYRECLFADRLRGSRALLRSNFPTPPLAAPNLSCLARCVLRKTEVLPLSNSSAHRLERLDTTIEQLKDVTQLAHGCLPCDKSNSSAAD